MGQKVNPNGIRIGITRGWASNWFTPKNKYKNAKPGLIIGQQGSKIDELRTKLEKTFDLKFGINVVELPKAGMDANVIAENIASQIERRISYRRVAKFAIEKAIESGAKGAKVRVSGRLNGVEIARSEFFTEGRIPLHTLRADIQYAEGTAHTTYGAIGVKVWIFKGEVFKNKIAENV